MHKRGALRGLLQHLKTSHDQIVEKATSSGSKVSERLCLDHERLVGEDYYLMHDGIASLLEEGLITRTEHTRLHQLIEGWLDKKSQEYRKAKELKAELSEEE